VSCQDAREDSSKKNPSADHFKTVGERIPYETGEQWIEAYNKQNNTNSRIGDAWMTISSDQFRAMLSSVNDLIGVAFQYGIDESGRRHMIAIPLDETLELWTNIPGRIYVDSNTGNEISQDVAYAWAQEFQASHPDGGWYHFFGKNVFDEIRAIPYFSTLDIMHAISTLDFTPQLLLIVRDIQLLSILGRSHSAQNTAVYDASYICPCGK